MKYGKTSLEVASPCLSICVMDEATGHCRGCLRTLEEITRWERYSSAQKRDVLARLAERRKQFPGGEIDSADC